MRLGHSPPPGCLGYGGEVTDHPPPLHTGSPKAQNQPEQQHELIKFSYQICTKSASNITISTASVILDSLKSGFPNRLCQSFTKFSLN